MQSSLDSYVKENKKQDYINHEYIKQDTIFYKEFQREIADRAINENTAVILPTGVGKTIIAYLVMAKKLPCKVLFLAPTRPLVNQHYEYAKKFINIEKEKIQLLTGKISRSKRKEIFLNSNIIISTPQTIKNDLDKGFFNLNDVSLVIFDEMHKAVENYAYVHIASCFEGLILGLTASPGSKKTKMEKVFTNLKIKNVESMDKSKLQEYTKETTFEFIKIPLTKNILEIRKKINELFLEKLEKLKKFGILTYKSPGYISKTDVINARGVISSRLGKRPYAFAAFHNHSILLQAYHCQELVDTQGIEPFVKYIDAMEKKKRTKTENSFLKDKKIIKAIEKAKESKLSHPKLAALKKLVEEQFKKQKDSLILIFTQYRDTIPSIEKTLEKVKIAEFKKFIGQAHKNKEKGMSQQEQIEIINEFRKRNINVLIATSVAEEGIDIPNVNMVIFYEPVPSEIRSIQRKGRTGRTHSGSIKVLVAEDTKDIAYLNASIKKEKKMNYLIKKMER